MFSSRIQPVQVRIYRFTRDGYYTHFREFVRTDHIMAQTFWDNEVTLYKYCSPDDDHVFEQIADTYDPRCYHVINIYEDVPGIDHVGIVHRLTGYFTSQHIPLLYVNTFAYNLILVSDEYIDKARAILSQISNMD